MYRQERVLRKQMQTEGVELKSPGQMAKGERDGGKVNEWWVQKETQV